MVFEMARKGEADAQHVVAGFPDRASAEAYAEARMRASLETLRTDGQTAEELSGLWQRYGEDCLVVGGFAASDRLDRYIAEPADAGATDWRALAPERLGPPRKRYHVAALIVDDNNRSVWVGGFLSWPERPDNDALMAHYREEAVASFARHGIAAARPSSIHVTQIHELPDVPQPPADRRRLLNWQIELDFVCHGVTFGMLLDAVFSWPEEPAGAVLDAMTNVMVADALSVRGEGPSWSSGSKIRSLTVRQTTHPPTYPLA